MVERGEKGTASGPKLCTWPFRLWLLNLVIGCWIGSSWLAHGPPEITGAAQWFASLALLSTIAILSVVPYVVLRVGTLWLRDGAARWVHALGWTLFQLTLFVDTRIYSLFRYHFNGMVWNVLTAPDTGDTIQLSTKDLGLSILGILVMIVVQIVLATFLLRLDRERTEAERPTRLLRPTWVWGIVLVPAILAEKSLFAYADLRRDLEVTALARLFPLYQRLTVKEFAENVLAMELEDRPEVRLRTSGVLLDYPKSPVHAPADGPRPNILVLVIDSLRFDALGPETMPHVAEYAQSARTYTNHISGGNATRFGIFSMIYGLHGPYWHQIYEEKRSPVLMDVLMDAGYDPHVFSTASMSSPEFRSTAWVRMEESVTDRVEGKKKYARDTKLGEMVVEWVAARQAQKNDAPFFLFALLDSPHQKYSFPKENPPFTPYAEKVDYVDLSSGLDEETLALLHNAYRNAVHHADEVTGAILDGLDELGVLENTLVMITGDHGEEFGENGFWGHTSNFTLAQIQVPFVLGGPGVEAGVETGPTSHLDVPATLLEAIGVDPALRGEYSLGGSLLDGGRESLRLSSGWDTMGLIADDGIVVVPFVAYEGLTRGYGLDWVPMKDDSAFLASVGGELVRLARECARFLR